MDLSKEVKEKVLEKLSSLNLLSPIPLNPKERGLVSLLQFQGSLTNLEIEEALEKAVIVEGKASYETVMRGSHRPDHVGRPECLAYFIKQGDLSPGEVIKIPFDHGQTAEQFCGLYGKKDLLGELRKEILDLQSIIPR